ncbi:uncharacterized protein LOC110983618 [Acanthaster planci]|uniref:Uncharacterized protein LOC110983618 n=1 Tax=Acanthaster planci TaxID=133434 RepID=A0A8B7Z159_ACAPL|nr:uncharacterized protein LOC110983618 [Acanthaster planci]XP_022098702.1 uncharacterized protein LOC110983618 [Acanthaster planci]
MADSSSLAATSTSQLSPFSSDQRTDDVNLGAKDQWRLSGEFGRKGSGQEEFNGTFGIVSTQPGELAVADYWNKRVIICSNEGQHRGIIPLSERPRNIAVINKMCMLVVVDTSKHVKVFNTDKELAFQFSTVPLADIDNIEIDLRSIAVKADGTLIVGDIKRMVWTEHMPTDGLLLRTITVQIAPYYLAVDDSTDKVVISGYENKQVDITDRNGIVHSSIKPLIKGQPVGCCLGVRINQSGIYVGVSNGWNSAGHIHLYDANGVFLDCLAQGLTFPLGIAFSSDGQLAVAEGFSVKMYDKA